MLEFPEIIQIPLAQWIDSIMSWLLHNWSGFFDTIGDVILYMLVNIERFLLWIPWIVVVLLVGLLSWRVMRRWWAALIMAAFMVLIGSFGYWDLAMMTLSIITASEIISLGL